METKTVPDYIPKPEGQAKEFIAGLLGEPTPEMDEISGTSFLWSYWEGEKPEIIELCIETIIKHNPNFRVLDPDAIRALGGGHVLDWLDSIELPDGQLWGPPQRSDLIRFWLLWKFGGIWIDTDYICFKPLDMLADVGDLDLLGCWNRYHKKGFGQQMLGTPFGGRAGSPVMKMCFEACYLWLDKLKRGHHVKYGMTSVGLLSLIYKTVAKDPAYAVERRPHWKYHRVPWTKAREVFNRPGKSWRLEYDEFWNPNAFCCHITNVTTDQHKHSCRDDLLHLENLLGFMFNRALGLPGAQSMMGRSYEIIQRLPEGRPTIGVEVGVFQGRNARAVLQQRPQCTLLLVDPWGDNGNEERYAKSLDARQAEPPSVRGKNMKRTQKALAWAGDRAQVRRTVSLVAAKEVKDSTLDMAFIDAEHTYDGVKEDIAAWWPKVKPGCYMGGHDYAPRWGGSKQAVDEFAEDSKLTLEQGTDGTWFFLKPEETNDG